jgi:hypothetical protein
MDESNNYYVSSRGLMKSCDYYSKTPHSGIRSLINYSETKFKNLKNINNPTIYICSNAMNDFCQRLLPSIDFPFILVSGDCDETVPYDIFYNDQLFQIFINNKNLIHWFCQNIVVTHPKITNMPIGMDYHTMTSSSVWGSIISSLEQENILNNIIKNSKPFYERQIKCYANFHFLMTTKYGYDRIEAINQIPKELVYYEPIHIPRLDTWNIQKEYAFIISPHGNGFDCHRTWEALAIGCIPIVKTSKIDVLYDDLPILIVKEWSDVTADILQTTVEKFKNKTFNLDKLSLKYWITLFGKVK